MNISKSTEKEAYKACRTRFVWHTSGLSTLYRATTTLGLGLVYKVAEVHTQSTVLLRDLHYSSTACSRQLIFLVCCHQSHNKSLMAADTGQFLLGGGQKSMTRLQLAIQSNQHIGSHDCTSVAHACQLGGNYKTYGKIGIRFQTNVRSKDMEIRSFSQLLIRANKCSNYGYSCESLKFVVHQLLATYSVGPSCMHEIHIHACCSSKMTSYSS